MLKKFKNKKKKFKNILIEGEDCDHVVQLFIKYLPFPRYSYMSVFYSNIFSDNSTPFSILHM